MELPGLRAEVHRALTADAAIEPTARNRPRDPPELRNQVARLAGIEPATRCLEGSRSIR